MERPIPEMRLSQALQIVVGLFSNVHPEHNLLQELIRLADGVPGDAFTAPKIAIVCSKSVPRFMEWLVQLHRHFIFSGKAETIDAIHGFHTLNQHRRMITNPPVEYSAGRE